MNKLHFALKLMKLSVEIESKQAKVNKIGLVSSKINLSAVYSSL